MKKKEKQEKVIALLLKWIRRNDFGVTYPNTNITLRTCACNAISNCFARQLFLVFKRIKTYLHTSKN